MSEAVIEKPELTEQQAEDLAYARLQKKIGTYKYFEDSIQSGGTGCCGMLSGKPPSKESMLGINLWVTEEPDPVEFDNVLYEKFEYDGKVLNIALLQFTSENQETYEKWKEDWFVPSYTYASKHFPTQEEVGIFPVSTSVYCSFQTLHLPFGQKPDGLFNQFTPSLELRKKLIERFFKDNPDIKYILTIDVDIPYSIGTIVRDQQLMEELNLKKLFMSSKAYNVVHPERQYNSLFVNIYEVMQ